MHNACYMVFIVLFKWIMKEVILWVIKTERLESYAVQETKFSLDCSQPINQSHKIAAADTFKLLRYFYFLKINLSLYCFFLENRQPPYWKLIWWMYIPLIDSYQNIFSSIVLLRLVMLSTKFDQHHNGQPKRRKVTVY